MATRKQRDKRKRRSARERAEKHGQGYQSTSIRLPEGAKFFAVEKEGVKRIDILPFIAGEGNPYAEKGEAHWERTYWVHRGIGPNKDSYVCPRKTAGKPCPICEEQGRLNKDPDVDADMVRELAPKERQLWLLYDLDDDEEILYVWDVSYHLFGKVLDNRIKNSDEDDGYEYYYDLEEGMTLKVGMDAKTYASYTYYECVSIDFKVRRENYSESLIDKLPCLDECLIIPTYEELKKAFLQVEDSTEEEEEEEKPPKRRRKREEEEEEEEPPKKRRRKPEPEPEPEDDEDEDDIDDDEDDEEEEEVAEDACVACSGSGKSTSGRKCRACHGTGKKKVKGEEDEPKPKEERKRKPKPEPEPEPEDVDDDGADDDDDDDDDDDWANWDDED